MRSLLLIDDDKDDASLLEEALAEVDRSVQFVHFEDPREAIQLLADGAITPPDLIFLDINMPSMSGWQCLQNIKSHPGLRHIPVAMYTTSSHHREIETALESGAVGFIAKPNDYKEVKFILQSLVAADDGNLEEMIRKVSIG
jgi:CheY-like chemotaxis protein